MKFIAVIFLLYSFALQAGTIQVAVTLSPAGDFKAESSKARGFVEKKGTSFSATGLSVEVGTMKTGLELRDKHFHERLGGPKAKIVITNASGTQGKGQGQININNITKPFSFDYKEIDGQVQAKFNLIPSDFGVKDVKYLGIGVEDKVNITASMPVR
jgi:hypothetical protein